MGAHVPDPVEASNTVLYGIRASAEYALADGGIRCTLTHQQVIRTAMHLVDELQAIVNDVKNELADDPSLPYTWAVNELEPVSRAADWIVDVASTASPRFARGMRQATAIGGEDHYLSTEFGSIGTKYIPPGALLSEIATAAELLRGSSVMHGIALRVQQQAARPLLQAMGGWMALGQLPASDISWFAGSGDQSASMASSTGIFFVRARPGWAPRVSSERAWTSAFALQPANIPHALMPVGLARRVLRLGKISNLLRVATETSGGWGGGDGAGSGGEGAGVEGVRAELGRPGDYGVTSASSEELLLHLRRVSSRAGSGGMGGGGLVLAQGSGGSAGEEDGKAEEDGGEEEEGDGSGTGVAVLRRQLGTDSELILEAVGALAEQRAWHSLSVDLCTRRIESLLLSRVWQLCVGPGHLLDHLVATRHTVLQGDGLLSAALLETKGPAVAAADCVPLAAIGGRASVTAAAGGAGAGVSDGGRGGGGELYSSALLSSWRPWESSGMTLQERRARGRGRGRGRGAGRGYMGAGASALSIAQRRAIAEELSNGCAMPDAGLIGRVISAALGRAAADWVSGSGDGLDAVDGGTANPVLQRAGDCFRLGFVPRCFALAWPDRLGGGQSGREGTGGSGPGPGFSRRRDGGRGARLLAGLLAADRRCVPVGAALEHMCSALQRESIASAGTGEGGLSAGAATQASDHAVAGDGLAKGSKDDESAVTDGLERLAERRPVLWCPRKGPGAIWHGLACDVRGAFAVELVVDVPLRSGARGGDGQLEAELDVCLLLRPAAEEVGEGDLPQADCELAAAGVCSRVARASRSRGSGLGVFPGRERRGDATAGGDDDTAGYLGSDDDDDDEDGGSAGEAGGECWAGLDAMGAVRVRARLSVTSDSVTSAEGKGEGQSYTGRASLHAYASVVQRTSTDGARHDGVELRLSRGGAAVSLAPGHTGEASGSGDVAGAGRGASELPATAAPDSVRFVFRVESHPGNKRIGVHVASNVGAVARSGAVTGTLAPSSSSSTGSLAGEGGGEWLSASCHGTGLALSRHGASIASACRLASRPGLSEGARNRLPLCPGRCFLGVAGLGAAVRQGSGMARASRALLSSWTFCSLENAPAARGKAWASLTALQDKAAALMAGEEAQLAGLDAPMPSTLTSCARQARSSGTLRAAAGVVVPSGTWSCAAPSYQVQWPLPLLVPRAHQVVLSELGRVLLRIRAGRKLLHEVWRRGQQHRIGFRAGGLSRDSRTPHGSPRAGNGGGRRGGGRGSAKGLGKGTAAGGSVSSIKSYMQGSPRNRNKEGSGRNWGTAGAGVGPGALSSPAPFTVLDVVKEGEAGGAMAAAGSKASGRGDAAGDAGGVGEVEDDEDEDSDEGEALLRHHRTHTVARARRAVAAWRHEVGLASWQLQHGLGAVEDFLQVDVVQAETDRLMGKIAEAGAGGGSGSGAGAAGAAAGASGASGSTGFAELQDAHAEYVSRLVLRSGLARDGVANAVEGLVRCAEELASVAMAAESETGEVVGGKIKSGIVQSGVSGGQGGKAGRKKKWNVVRGFLHRVEEEGLGTRHMEDCIEEGRVCRLLVRDIRARGRKLAERLLSEAYGYAGVQGTSLGAVGAGDGGQVYSLSSGGSLGAVEVRVNANGWLDQS